MTTGVTINQQDGNLGASTPTGRRPHVVIGAADAGPFNSPRALTRKKQITDLFTAGPLVEECIYAIAKGLTVVPIRVQANQVGSVSAVSNTAMAGTSDGSINASHDAPNGNYSVKILFPIGGTIGEAGIYYQISLNGGTSYGPATALGTANLIAVTGAGDVQVDLSAGTVIAADYLTFTTTATSAGTLGTITDSEGGTSVITHHASSTCNDDYEVEVVFTVGGTISTSGIKYRFRVGPDQGTTGDPWTGWSQEYQLGTATSITIPNTGGVRLALGAGTITASRTLSFVTTAPSFDSSDLQDGLDVLEAYTKDWEILTVVGPVDGTMFAAIDLLMNTLYAEPIGRDRMAVCGWRKPNVDEDNATYQAAFLAAIGGQASVLGYTVLASGSVKVTSNGRTLRRSPAFTYGPSLAAVEAHIMLARRSAPGGPLIGCNILDSNGNPDDHDEKYTPGFEDLRALCLCSWSDRSGTYVFWDRTFAAEASDFALVPHRRIMNLGIAPVRTYARDQIAVGLAVDPATGHLLPDVLDRLNRDATRVLRSALKGKISSGEVRFAGDDDLTAEGAELNFDVDIIPLLYPKRLIGTFGLKNPLRA